MTARTTTLDATRPRETLDFATVYVAGYPATLTRALRQLGGAAQLDHGLAEEVAQEAWMRVWRHWHDELERQPALVVYAWALRATTTVAIDLQRRWALMARHGQVRMTDEMWAIAQDRTADETSTGQPEAAALDAEALAEVWGFMTEARALHPTRLGTTSTRGVALFEALLADEPQQLTARRLGLTVGQVKTCVWRLRARLRARLSGDEASDGEEAEAV